MLSKSPKYLRKNRCGKDIILSLFIKIIGLFLGFFISIFLARVLGIHLFGDYKLAFSWISIIMLLSLAGNNTNIIRITPRKSKQYLYKFVGLVVKQSEIIFLCLSIIFFIITFFVKSNTYNSINFKISYAIAFVFGIFNVINKIIQSSLAGNYLNYKVTTINLIYIPICKVAFIIITYFLSHNNFVILTSIIMAEFIAVIFSSKIFNRIYKNVEKIKFNSKGLTFNISFLVISLSYLLLSTSDRIMLSFWYSVDKVGGYSAAARISEITMIFCVGFAPFLPKISELFHNSKLETLEASYLTITKLISLFTFPIVIYFIFYGDRLLGLYGKDFKVFSSVIIFLSLGRMFDAITGPVGSMLDMTKFEKYSMKLVITVATLNILLNLLLIPKFAVMGAAFATMVSIGSINIIKLFVANKVLCIKTFSLKHLQIFFLFIVFIAINFFVKNTYNIDIYRSVIVLIINYLLFIGLSIIFNFISIKNVKKVFAS